MTTSDTTGGTVYWVTGLPGAGKTTIATEIVAALGRTGSRAILLDGDELRTVFGGEHGYDYDSRLKLAMSYARLCRMLAEQGHVVVCATVSMFEQVRSWNRAHIGDYREIYIRATEQALRQRRALYRDGTHAELVVATNPRYELPRCPHLTVDNDGAARPQDIANEALAFFRTRT